MREVLCLLLVCVHMELAASGKAFELLEGGLTNRNYVADVEGIPIVVRVGRENAEELGIDRKREYLCHSFGAEAGISPKIYCFDRESGLLVSRFIDGGPLSEEQLRKPETLKKIAELIKKYHAAPYKQGYGSTNPREMIDHYWKQIRKRRIRYPDRIIDALEIVNDYHQRYFDLSDCVLCHNDLLSLNFIRQGDEIWLIDWEYGVWNDRFCDLASLCSLNNLDRDDRLAFLKYYFGRTEPEDLKRLNAMCAVMCLRDALWSLLQKEKGANRIDYGRYFDEYFAAFWREVERGVNPQ